MAIIGSSPMRAAFSSGNVPRIAVFNKATTPLGVDLDLLIAALQIYIDEHVAPVWGTPAKLVKSRGYLKKAWALIFVDDADQPGVLAYHDLTPDGYPQSKVFVRTTIDNGDKVSVSASHELVEMLVDPAINLLTTGPDPKMVYAYESADPVEATEFPVNGLAMSNFVYPSYFEDFHKPNSVLFDHLGKVKKPFQILKGGYQIIFKNGKWGELYGSPQKKAVFKKEDRRGHRSEQRAVSRLRPADPGKVADLEAKAAQGKPRSRSKAPARLEAGPSPVKADALKAVTQRPRKR